MKKKLGLLIVCLLSIVLVLTSCKKALEPDKAAILLVNRFIYNQQDPRFEQNFKNGEALAKELQKNKKVVATNLVGNFNQFGEVLSQKQTEQLLTIWLKRISKNTQYEVVKVDEDKRKKHVTVTLAVKGLDFHQAYGTTMDNMVAELLSDKEVARNSMKTGDLIISLLTTEMAKADPIKKPVEVSLVLKKEKGQWSVVSNKQKDEMATLLLAFMTGVSNVVDYEKEVRDAVQSSLDRAYDQLDAEYSNKKPGDEQEDALKNDAQKDKDASATKSSKQQEVEASQQTQTKVDEETLETYDDNHP